MGDEKESWKVKTLDEILQEKKRRKEQEEKADIKRLKNAEDWSNRGKGIRNGGEKHPMKRKKMGRNKFSGC